MQTWVQNTAIHADMIPATPLHAILAPWTAPIITAACQTARENLRTTWLACATSKAQAPDLACAFIGTAA